MSDGAIHEYYDKVNKACETLEDLIPSLDEVGNRDFAGKMVLFILNWLSLSATIDAAMKSRIAVMETQETQKEA